MEKRKSLIFGLFASLILAAIACNARVNVIQGSGDVITETRQASNFDSVELNGSGKVIITQGGSESLTIETDDNVMKYVEAKVDGNTLKLGLVTGNETGVNIQSASRLVFNVGVVDLKSLTTSGSGDINSESIETDSLEATVNGSGGIRIADLSASELKAEIGGSGEIELSGDVNNQDINIGGSGKYLGGDLCGESVKVTVDGSGKATVCAIDKLDADVSGSGSVNYYGQPALNTSGSGSGNINSLGEK